MRGWRACASEKAFCKFLFIFMAGSITDGGIARFTVCPRPRMSKGSQTAFKVKSILTGTEYDGESFISFLSRGTHSSITASSFSL
jgi:hypothetical protein